jgi:hypothetical protein
MCAFATISFVVPRRRGPITTEPGFNYDADPQPKAMRTVLTNKRHGVWVPAFAGSTS